MNNLRIVTIKNAKFSGYYFHMNLKIWGDFQNCISVPLIKASHVNDQELLDIIDLVDQKCQLYLKYEKPKLIPVVSFSLS